ncbi:protein FLX-like 1 isoform X2 [Punica granatum]|uniref:Protein FLX-like 1 isoform X2 n=1 Tax=Punica granatum TaxID=22663 RepID=A0A6P8BP54_PUNGR|nr:protein FLX-like 1 isoform X2 [Punica granatum]XP_031372099.1 protein FLX-like 1 isoform X2 [Punica granatum]
MQERMSGRNRSPPPPMKGIPRGGIPPPVHEPPFGRGLGLTPHPALLEEFPEPRFSRVPGPRLPPHPAIIEDRLAVQHEEIQGLLVDNQRLAATHVALKQELEAAQYELQRMVQVSDSLRAEKDVHMRELYEKCMRMEVDLRAVEAMRAELSQVNADIKELTSARQDLTGQVQVMNQDLARMTADLRQVPALKADIENMKQEVQRVRTAIEYEKKGSAENYEHGQVMEQKLISMARELEKLRAEIANAEKRAHAVAVAGNPGAGASYIAPYGNPEAAYAAGNPYPVNYGINPVPAGAEGYAQYGHGPAAWGAYDMHRAQGHR